MRSLPTIEYNTISPIFYQWLLSVCFLHRVYVSTSSLKVGIGKICYAKVYATQVYGVCDIKELFQVVRNMQ